MVKVRLKQSLALLLACFMAFSICIPSAFAEEDEETADNDIVVEEVEASNESDSAISDAESGNITYAVINDPELTAPADEEILVGIGDESVTAEQAILTIQNQSTGATAEYSASALIEGAALFTVSYSADETGAYELTAIQYTYNGVDYSVSFADAGIEAVFGVNTEADSDPDAVVVEDTETATDESATADVVFDVTSIDDNGGEELADSVEEALYSASSEDNISLASLEDEISLASTGKEYVVVLDPGHGTHKTATATLDSGTSFKYKGVTYYEKDITLKIAQYCKQELEKYSNVKVYMTRTGDYDGVMSIHDRVDIAKNYGADILVSIHINSAGTGSSTTTAKGAEVYYPNSNGGNGSVSTEAKKLSEKILNQLVSVGLSNRGVKIRNATEDEFSDGTKMDYYGINRYSKEYGFPGIIVEHAFLNNESDFYNYLSTDSQLQKLGVADATGIANYLGLTKSSSSGTTTEDKNLTVYSGDGIDYSPVYNYDYYTSHYPEVVKAVGTSPSAVLKYFVEVGMSKCQQGCAEFDPVSYRLEYSDLRNIYGNVWAGYYRHYARWGKAAGLHGTGCTQMQDYVTKYSDGIDYAPVYDYNYYISKYPELFEKYGYDDSAVLQYFVETGMWQKDRASEEFDVDSYYNEYADLRAVYGTVWAGYYRHYARWGKAGGLHGSGCNEKQGYVTVYSDGIDYAPVYDYNYYTAKHPELLEKYGNDDYAVLKYFVEVGMGQMDQASAEFDPISYRYEYANLRKVYGNVWAGYYRHYARWGKAAGLHGTGCTQMQDYTTVYSGDNLDYACVYDYNYYVAQHPEVEKQCNYDDFAVLKYFVEVGMWQKQQGSTEFNVDYYRATYAQLQSVYGEQWAGYYRHYVRWGKAAGWYGSNEDNTGYSIIGVQSTTVDQMVRFLNSKKVSFNETLYGMTMREFCQLYIEECKTEGVDVAVAFCQAMLETGWLKYGGQVQASQFNFAGIKTKDGAAFQTFTSVQEGIRAQVQHLKAYASTEALVNACVDPRFSLVKRGTAPYVEWLCVSNNPNGTGWTPDTGYSDKILTFIDQLHKA